MRANTLQRLLPLAEWTLVDTDREFRSGDRIWTSMAFRLKSGPLVSGINREVCSLFDQQNFDLIWVDKGIYLWPTTVEVLRAAADRLVHYTPDTAFHANRSRHFIKSAHLFDLLVTTKSFEVEQYKELVNGNSILLTTQAFDADLHQPLADHRKKLPVTTFIGLCEPDREVCVKTLLDSDIPVRVGGHGWQHFARSQSDNPNFEFLGSQVFGSDYVSEYSHCSVGLGLLSKRFPELHTTRTFEIPACGTLLATERTVDTVTFFDEDEVLFFEDYLDLSCRLKALFNSPDEIAERASRGHQRVLNDGRDYTSVLSGVLERVKIPH